MAANGRSPDKILRAFSQGAGSFVALASFLAFLGEALAIQPVLTAFRLIPIQANQQALMGMLLGLALYCQHLDAPMARRLSRALALAVAATCLLTLGELVLGWPLGFDRVTFPPGFGALSGAEFARMSFPSAFQLGLLGLALYANGRFHGWPADLLTLIALVHLLISVLIIGLRIQFLYDRTFEIPVGVLVIVALMLGMLAAHPDRGIMKVILTENSVGVVLRRLLPAALLGPPLIGWLWSEGQYRGIFEAPQGMFFVVLAMTVVTLGLVLWNIAPLARLERAREEALKALQESETRARRLAAIVEASEDGITTYDPETWKLTYWSRGAEKLWGWSSEEALGKPAGFLTQPREPEKFRAAIADLKAGKAVTVHDVLATRKDGTRRDLSVGFFPIRDAKGRITAFGSIQRDVTEQRKMLLAVAARTAELSKAQELNALKDHFLSTISHEMKTPLSLITGYTELLEDTCPDEAMIAGIKDGSRRLSEHIDNILDYSALISGTLPLHRTELDLQEVAHHVESVMQEGFQQKGISLTVDVSPDTPVVDGDFRRVSQILVELLDNAQKFTPEGGKAGVRIGPEGDQARLDVWNTGEGIPEEDLERIWEAFSQLATADAFRKGGLGLGLTIVKRLVELHGGRVTVASQVGQGATFTVYLPAAHPQAKGI